MECSIDKCQAACCKFMTWQMPTYIPDDAIYWLNLHGIEAKRVGNGSTHLKIPVPCQALDSATLKCKVYEKRPQMCREYPLFESPFIPKENCNLLMELLSHSHNSVNAVTRVTAETKQQ